MDGQNLTPYLTHKHWLQPALSVKPELGIGVGNQTHSLVRGKCLPYMRKLKYKLYNLSQEVGICASSYYTGINTNVHIGVSWFNYSVLVPPLSFLLVQTPESTKSWLK